VLSVQHEAGQGTWNWTPDLGANTKEPAKPSEKGGGSEVWKIHKEYQDGHHAGICWKRAE